MEKMVFSPKGRIQRLIDEFGSCHTLVITMLEIYGSDAGEFVVTEKQEQSVLSCVDSLSDPLSPQSP